MIYCLIRNEKETKIERYRPYDFTDDLINQLNEATLCGLDIYLPDSIDNVNLMNSVDF